MRRARLLALAAAAWLAAAAPVSGQLGDYHDHPAWPDTPAARRAQEVLEVINAGDPERANRFAREAYDPAAWSDLPDDAKGQFLIQVHRGKGNLRFHAVRTYPGRPDADDIVVILRSERTELWVGLYVKVDPRPPHRIVALTVNAARPPRDPETAAVLEEDDVARELRGYLERAAARGDFSGTVIVAREGRILLEAAVGVADRAAGTPVRPETRFRLASLNKMFTAVAMGQLVERGVVAYDDPVGKYLGARWIDPDLGRRITLRQLLTHTSGLGDYLDAAELRRHPERFRRLSGFQRIARRARPAFEPGTAWGYSNLGFVLLGAVLEMVSGGEFDDYFREHLYRPLGMERTGCEPVDRVGADRALPYERLEGDGGPRWARPTASEPIRGGPAGGCFSTARDLLRFAEGLRAGVLLPRRRLQEMWTPSPASRSRLPYGMGFAVYAEGPRPVVGHGGGFPGISTQMEIHLDRGYTVIALANQGGAAAPAVQKANELMIRLEPGSDADREVEGGIAP